MVDFWGPVVVFISAQISCAKEGGGEEEKRRKKERKKEKNEEKSEERDFYPFVLQSNAFGSVCLE